MEEVEVTIKLPKHVGFRYTGEFRQAKPGEFYTDTSTSVIWKHDGRSNSERCYFILKRSVYPRPAWLRAGWLRKKIHGYEWFEYKPDAGQELATHIPIWMLSNPADMPDIAIGETVRIE